MITFISERALVARINRVLKKTNELLKVCREDSRAYPTLGRYYTLNYHGNIDCYGLDIDSLAEDCGIDARLADR